MFESLHTTEERKRWEVAAWVLFRKKQSEESFIAAAFKSIMAGRVLAMRERVSHRRNYRPPNQNEHRVYTYNKKQYYLGVIIVKLNLNCKV